MQKALLLLAIGSLLASEAYSQNTAIFAYGRLPRTLTSTMSLVDADEAEKYVGQWKMSSWNGIYRF